MSEVNVEAAEIIRGIAADIITYGHYQEPKDEPQVMYHYATKSGKCCLIVNPTVGNANLNSSRGDTAARRAMEELCDVFDTPAGFLAELSDRVPTDKLIAALLAKAEELEAEL